MKKHVLIVGNGVAGVTAARFMRKYSDHRITMVSDETDHFFSRTALMYVYMGHMRYRDTKPYEDWFWAKNRIDLVRDRVTRLDLQRRVAYLRQGGELPFDVLLLATGSRPVRLPVPGIDLPGVQSLYGVPDLERMERDTRGIRRAVIVGGGLIGVEMAEMLHSRHIPVTFLVREPGYMDHVLPPEESALVTAEIRHHGIDLRLGTQLREIKAGADGRVASVVDAAGTEHACEFVGVTVGVQPNIDIVRETPIEARRGILVNRFFETNVEGVFAAGDCAEFRDPADAHRPVEQLWYTARRHGETVGRTIAGRRTAYDKGVFFNSAKFFDLEYQTYGDVPARPPGDQTTVFLRDPRRSRLVRVNANSATGAVMGFNALGIRLRQDVCERWIREGAALETVLSRLSEASFDPEFAPGLPAAPSRRAGVAA
ncbi:MAG TPA: NAD(P)/FAD-dependent oxidoreductase [Rhodothermales bacterium]